MSKRSRRSRRRASANGGVATAEITARDALAKVRDNEDGDEPPAGTASDEFPLTALPVEAPLPDGASRIDPLAALTTGTAGKPQPVLEDTRGLAAPSGDNGVAHDVGARTVEKPATGAKAAESTSDPAGVRIAANGNGRDATALHPDQPAALASEPTARSSYSSPVLARPRVSDEESPKSAGKAQRPASPTFAPPGPHVETLQAPAFATDDDNGPSVKAARKAAKKDAKEAPAARSMSTWQIAKRLGYFAGPHKLSLGFGFLMLVMQGIMDLAKPWPLAYSVDSVVTEDNLQGTALYTLFAAGGSIVLVTVLEGLFSYIRVMIVNRAGRTIVRDIRGAMFEHVQKLSLQFHSRRRSGDLLLRVSADVQALQKTFTDDFIEILSSAVFLIGLSVIMLYIDWQTGLLAIAGLPLLFTFIKRYSSEIRNYTAQQRQREGALASIFHEALGSTRLTRVFNREGSVRNKFEVESAEALELGLRATLREERFTWSVDVLGSVLTGAVLIFSVYRAQAGLISAGELFLLFFYARTFYRPIRTSIKNASRVWRSLAQAERIIDVLDTEYGVVDNTSSTPAPRFKGEIEFRDVAFSYDDDVALMQGVNLKLPAGSITAIIGPTGAGKTTLVSMVPRLYDPLAGQVLIDGRDIRGYTLESLRDQISVVLQETTLLYATVAENIAYGKPGAGLDEVEMAAWIAGAHEFIKELPKGYNTEVGERGETLSGGQRQLIAISRAIIRDAPIVILDEPMNGLDPVSAVQVRDGLHGLMEGRTVLLITHNLALLDLADYVVVVDNGRIAQQGTPQELRAREGIFMDLYRAQFDEEAAFAGAR